MERSFFFFAGIGINVKNLFAKEAMFMIMFTVTKPRRKLKRLLQAAALVLLLAVVVPGIYHSLESVGAMSLFASGEAVSGPAAETQEMATNEAAPPTEAQETASGEAAPPTEEQGTPSEAAPPTEAAESSAAAQADSEAAPAEENTPEAAAEGPGLWQGFLTVLFGEPPQVIAY